MADLHHQHQEPAIFNTAQNAPGPHAISPETGQIGGQPLAAGTGAFQFLQLGQISDDPQGFGGVDGGQLLLGTAGNLR